MFRPRGAHDCEPERFVSLLVGITGGGKSSAANTLCGAQRAFKRSASVVSETASTASRNYSFQGHRYRVVD